MGQASWRRSRAQRFAVTFDNARVTTFFSNRNTQNYFNVMVVQSSVFGHDVRVASDFTKLMGGSPA